MGNVAVRSATKLSSRPGRYAPPPLLNSTVVSTSTLRARLPSTASRMFCFVFFNSFSWTDRCLMIAVASLMLVVVET